MFINFCNNCRIKVIYRWPSNKIVVLSKAHETYYKYEKEIQKVGHFLGEIKDTLKFGVKL